MKFRAIVAGIAGALIISSAARAADVIVIPPPAPPPPMAVAPAGYDWSGPYAGAALLFQNPPGGLVGFGGQVGFNRARGNVVFGAEFLVLRPFGAPGVIAGVAGRVGFALGASGRLLPYVSAGVAFGIGMAIGIQPFVAPGVALGLTDNLSLFVERLFPIAGMAPPQRTIRAGINFQFGG